jgi:branched-chain amino acid transport system permease protein
MTVSVESPARGEAAVDEATARRAGQRVLSPRQHAVVLALVGAVLVAYPFVISASFWQNVGVLALTMGLAAAGWNVIGGFTGQISFGQAVFFAAGAYTTALLVRSGWSPWPSMLVGAAVAIALSVVIGFPTFRLRGHYFAIATIAAAEIARAIVDNTEALGAARGLTIPLGETRGLWTLQFSVRDKTDYYLVILALFAAASLLIWLVIRSRAGSYFRAIRDDQEAAAAAGIPVRRYKLYAFALSAALTSVAGSYFAMYVLFIDPLSAISLSVSISIALIAVLGGAGTLWGPLLGAWTLTALQERSRIELSGSGTAADLALFGVAIVIVAVFEPAGLAGGLQRATRWWRRRRSPSASPS